MTARISQPPCQYSSCSCSCAKMIRRQNELESKLLKTNNNLRKTLTQMEVMMQEVKVLRELVTESNISVNHNPKWKGYFFERKNMKAQHILVQNDSNAATAGTTLEVDFPLTNITITHHDDDAISEIGMPTPAPQNMIQNIFAPINNFRSIFPRETKHRSTRSLDSEDSRIEIMQLNILNAEASKIESSENTQSEERRHSRGVFEWWNKIDCKGVPVRHNDVGNSGNRDQAKIFPGIVPERDLMGLVGNQYSNRTKVLKMNMTVNENPPVKAPITRFPLTTALNVHKEILGRRNSVRRHSLTFIFDP